MIFKAPSKNIMNKMARSVLALYSYEDDPEDQDPLTVWPFSGKKAYGFECLCEDDSPMRVMFCELKKGLLAIISVVAEDVATLAEYVTMVEQRLRVKSADKLEQQ